MKKRRRFGIRIEQDGTRSILDIFTGEPASYLGKKLSGLDADSAKTISLLLNGQDLKRRAELGI